MKKFRTRSHLQKAILSYVATQKLDAVEEAKLKELFTIFDVDKDGKISMPELVSGYNQVYGDILRAKAEAKKIMHKMDLNKNGSIGYDEFLLANMNASIGLQEERLKEAFDFYDIVAEWLMT